MSLHSVDVVLTAGCNLSCSYCYQNDKQPAARMEWATLRRSLELLLRSRRREVTLGFYGGEPLLQFDLIRRAVQYVERRRRGDQTVRYATITNGTLLRDRQAAFLAAHRVQTQISFDGIPAAQAERGPGTFRVLDSTLDRLRREHPRYFNEDVRVSMTLLPHTVRHLADSVDYFIDKGVSLVRISPAVTDSSAWQVGDIEELDRQFSRVFKRSVEHHRETGQIPLGVLRRGAPDEEQASARPQRRMMCGAPGGEALAVDVDGEVHGCVMFAGSYQKFSSEFLRRQLQPMSVGHARQNGFRKKLRIYRERSREAGIFRRKQDKYSSYGRCGECRFLHDCDICPVSIGNIPGNTDPDRVPDFLCAFALISTKYRERFPRQPELADIAEGTALLPALMQELAERFEESPSTSL